MTLQLVNRRLQHCRPEAGQGTAGRIGPLTTYVDPIIVCPTDTHRDRESCGKEVVALVRRSYRITSSLIAVLLLGVLMGTAHAQPAPWKSGKGYENGIPIGTKITQANWQHYQQFMTEGMKAVFAGTYFWHMPKNVEIDVGPTRPIPAPKPYLEDTEKYGSQVMLEPQPDGGYVPKGYVAGFPFSNPFKGEPALTGERIYWNTFYRPAARVEQAPNCTYVLDSYGDFTRGADVNVVFSQLMHLSEPGFPRDELNVHGYWFAVYAEQTAPEQGKYSAELVLSPNDPSQLDEIYVYVPSLRRSLRLSQTVRCAPLAGTDFTVEDLQEGPPRQGQLFKKEYLGTKKILTLLHAAPESFDTCGNCCAARSEVLLLWLEGSGTLP